MSALVDTYSTAPQNLDLIKEPDRFINRELSWLSFNRRVLEEARRSKTPLIERLKFLAISGSNLDEFFMVRVAGIIGQISAGVEKKTPDGLVPVEQLEKINAEISDILQDQAACWDDLIEAFRAEEIYFPRQSELTEEDYVWAEQVFDREIFPILTPIAIDPAHPFPFIANCGVALALELYDPRREEKLQALVPMPTQLKRFFKMQGAGARFITREKIVLMFVDRLFPGFQLLERGVFRVLRDSDLEIDEDAEDLVRTFETALKRRRRGHVIRLSVNKGMPTSLKDFLREQLDIEETYLEVVEGFIGYADLSTIEFEGRLDLKFDPYVPSYPVRVKEFGGDCFAAIRDKDMILHHPYESFDVVVDFIKQAALDPSVMVIKQTLYRTSQNSPIVKSLIRAAESGKSVVAMVELKARFDEEANLRWARDLERAGVHVVYGISNLKTHAKISLVIRKEVDGLKSYVHFGTGNYHPLTAKIYTDLSFFSCDPELCEDAGRIFNFMTGYAMPRNLHKCSFAPVNLRETLIDRIDAEIAFAQAGKPAKIWAKMNSLVDPVLIDKFYEASQAGVEISLVIRGICCLRPQVQGLSENISVRSIIGRFLEHTRLYCFGNGHPLPSDRAIIYLSSADLMPRNLNRRIEALVPIDHPSVKLKILNHLMQANLQDTEQSWFLDGQGLYHRICAEKEQRFSVHDFFVEKPHLSEIAPFAGPSLLELEEGSS